ncbi:hypothetical protein BGW80DRAFT_1368779 [Lactifluus volemus]|nr:hypothetical protein BGW80DRAFT_1368779 [Lactifluus volemus]
MSLLSHSPLSTLLPLMTRAFSFYQDFSLTENPPDDSSWLTPFSLPVHVHPSHNLSTWHNLARESWRQGHVAAHCAVPRCHLAKFT